MGTSLRTGRRWDQTHVDAPGTFSTQSQCSSRSLPQGRRSSTWPLSCHHKKEYNCAAVTETNKLNKLFDLNTPFRHVSLYGSHLSGGQEWFSRTCGGGTLTRTGGLWGFRWIDSHNIGESRGCGGPWPEAQAPQRTPPTLSPPTALPSLVFVTPASSLQPHQTIAPRLVHICKSNPQIITHFDFYAQYRTLSCFFFITIFVFSGPLSKIKKKKEKKKKKLSTYCKHDKK